MDFDDESESVVLFVIHRIAVDAWSTVVLLDDLRILYTDPPKPQRNTDRNTGRDSSLAPSPTFGMSSSFGSGGSLFNGGSGGSTLPRLRAQFVEYRDWLERTLDSSAEGERLWEYWLRKLGGDLPVLDLPTDFPRKAGDASAGDLSSQNGIAYRFSIEADVMASLIEFAREPRPLSLPANSGVSHAQGLVMLSLAMLTASIRRAFLWQACMVSR